MDFLVIRFFMAVRHSLYQAQFVPVGQDQQAHVELTREVARRFNFDKYKDCDIFPEPEVLLTPSPKLTGTDGRKMSKSYGNTIGLTEAPALVAKKVVEMSTNGQRIRQTDPGDPDLCPVGDLHKVFSSPEMIAFTQQGCRTATLRCEFCKVDAANSVCAVTEPIHTKRMYLESRIDDTWEMLCKQSADASKRAEKTMVPVRAVFGVSRDLGSVRRHFASFDEDKRDPHDLSQNSDWWTLPHDLRAKQLRGYWQFNILPREVHLSEESNRVFSTLDREMEEPFITSKRKRVFVTTSRDEIKPDIWHFEIPSRSYEVWALLCWHKSDYWLNDFIVPQKHFASQFVRAKKSLEKNGKVVVKVIKDPRNKNFFLQIANGHEELITELRSNYEPLM